jgi:K+-sensing histidine kinase KdpD
MMSRPNPDELLRRVQEDEKRANRGKLTVFFGAAPGVGKTYAMLEAARSERDLARDVMVGVVETHGRYDTAALLIGLDLLGRASFWSMSSRIPTRRGRATPSAGRMSRSCSTPASMSTRRSTCNTSRA